MKKLSLGFLLLLSAACSRQESSFSTEPMYFECVTVMEKTKLQDSQMKRAELMTKVADFLSEENGACPLGAAARYLDAKMTLECDGEYCQKKER